MIRIFLTFSFLLSLILNFGCTKDSTLSPEPTPIDTLQLLMDSIEGDYYVFGYVENSHLGYPTVYDTLGFDTLHVLQAGTDSIEMMNYLLPLYSNQPLDSSVLWFVDYHFFPPFVEEANFYLMNDSIEFRISNHPGLAGGVDTIYRGRQLN